MARGNQRDKAREKNLKEAAGVVSMATSTTVETVRVLTLSLGRKRRTPYSAFANSLSFLGRLTSFTNNLTQQSGTEFQRTKEQQAEIMRKKQEEGEGESK